MNPNADDIAESYAGMSEPRLMEIARAYDSLTETAQSLLRAEFSRRRLPTPMIDDAESSSESGRKLVTIRRYRDLSEAIVARSLLESAGIPVYLRDENMVRMEWQISNFIGGMRLQVDEVNESSATELLNQPIPDNVRFDENAEFAQPVCPRCGSKDITFQGASRGAALASLYLLSLPLPFGEKTWFCNACEARWVEDDGEADAPNPQLLSRP